MARIWTTGFEFGSALPDLTAVTAIAIETAVVRPNSGIYSIKGTANPTWEKVIASLSEFYYRTAYQCSLLTYAPRPIGWYKDSTELGTIRIKSSAPNYIEAWVGGTNVATSTVNFITNTWYLFEVYVKIADTGGRIIVKVDGSIIIDYTGDTQPGADTTVNVIKGAMTVSAGNQYWDDIALNDTTGTADNSWCGDGYIKAIMPDAVGTYTQLTPVGVAANWDAVNERPKNDDTDYVYGTVLDGKDTYNLAASGLSNVSIKRIWVEILAKENVAGGGKIAARIKSGATEAQGADQALTLSYARYVEQWLTDPNTGVAWTVAALDALEAGVVVR